MEKIICGVEFVFLFNQNTSEKKEWRNLHSEWRFLHSEWRKFPVEVFFPKKKQKRFWKAFEWRNLHSEWRFLHSEWRKFSVDICFKVQNTSEKKNEWRKFSVEIVFKKNQHTSEKIEWRKLFVEIFLKFKPLLKKKFEWRNLHSEWRNLHLFFLRSVFHLQFHILQKNGENAFQQKWMEISPFWMEISPFWMEKSFWNTIYREFSKKKLKTLLKNLNGEISIQNGEISIHFFLRSVLHQFFSKKEALFTSKVVEKRLFFFWMEMIFQYIFLAWQIGNKQKKTQIIHSSPFRMEKSPFWMEISPFILFQKRFEPFFEKNLNREFSPFKMEKSPFWMEISPFKCFSEAFRTFFEKNLQGIFSI